MRKLNKASLGATVFYASSHPCESCGSNGLPLTPNSIKLVGRFQILKTIDHSNLCKYIDISRQKQERVIIVAEHYPRNLLNKYNGEIISLEELLRIAHQVLQGLAHLNMLNMVHRCLSPENILLDSSETAKLAKFGLYHMTDGGTCVSFPIGNPAYMSPEVLALGPLNGDHGTIQSVNISAPNSDIWSLGIILLELATGLLLFQKLPLEQILKSIIKTMVEGINESAVYRLIKGTALEEKFVTLHPDIKSLIENCLLVNPVHRPNPKDLLCLPIFTLRGFHIEKNTLKPVQQCFPSTELRYNVLNLPIQIDNIDDNDHLGRRSLEEVYYLWKLAGGDLDGELRRQGMIKTKPPICSLPKIVIEEGEMFGQKKDRAFLLDENVIVLSLAQLRQRLSKIPPEAFYPLTEDLESKMPASSINNMSDLAETASLPLVIREKDIEYQFHRIVLYQRLLLGYPYKRPHIWKEARIDIPPLYRGHVWAVLLDIEGDTLAQYDDIDKETPTITDRQIEVDIPRCHQYDELLSSPTGHLKFKRLLKAWVISHPHYVYWQGLDSLCAPFLYLNFNDEALAYACFSAFIDKYLYRFFLKDNSTVIQEYLAVFSHLIAFHDPELTNHLNSIGFIPELYAIPWFLTMYTHVFPLHKIFHLWDTLLLGNASFPLSIGVAILQQLRDNLLSFGFNECILLFSDMPEIDIERCVRDSIKIFCSTPKSATYRQHERTAVKSRSPSYDMETQLFKVGNESSVQQIADLGMDPVNLEILKNELCPRISAEDLLELLEKDQANLRAKLNRAKPKLFVVDVRPAEEFLRGAMPDSINIPFQTAFSPECTLNSCPEVTALNANRGRLIIVIGKKDNHAANFAHQLIQLGFPRVCTLHKGIDILRHTGILVVPAAEVRTP